MLVFPFSLHPPLASLFLCFSSVPPSPPWILHLHLLFSASSSVTPSISYPRIFFFFCTSNSRPLYHPFLTLPRSISLSSHSAAQRPTSAGTRCLPVCPQHQQRSRVGPYQLLQRSGNPQHVPRRPAAGCPWPAELRLPWRARIPITVTRQQPGPQGTWCHRDFQQVHIQVCTQVSNCK